MIKYLLTSSEQLLAKVQAEMDLLAAADRCQLESHGQDNSPLPVRLRGHWGELAFESASGLPHKYHDIYAPDTRIAEVRTVSKDYYGLIYRQADVIKGPACRFVSVSAEHFPIMWIRGWMSGQELRTKRCFENASRYIQNNREKCCLGLPPFHPISGDLLQEWVRSN